MRSIPLLGLLLLLPLGGSSLGAGACAVDDGSPAPDRSAESGIVIRATAPPSPAGRVQPPDPGEPTPEPGEPIEPPVLDEPDLEPDDPGIPTPDPSAPCCFTHPRYAGVCAVRPAEDETCGSILAYLNDHLSVGKTYCNNTDLRGGWEWVLCE